MRINQAGIELIKRFEGCNLKPYVDAAGFWTIGWGHRILEPDEHHLMGGVTVERAEQLLAGDLAAAARGVEKHTDLALTDNQASALISFVFNLGAGRYRDSTLRRLVNQRRFREAADQFPLWVKAGSKILPGLVRRRDAERALFLKADLSGRDV